MLFQPGDVLKVTRDDRLIRVLMADDAEAFYDALFPEVGWNLARARTAVYYRTTTSLLQSSANRVRTHPLTREELEKHRPDLPMRLFRSREADWHKPIRDWPKIDADLKIACERLALIPYGPKGAPLKPVVVEAADGRAFSGAELLAAANEVQAAECPAVEGAGLYRSGISRGIPSYYLWGATDKAGHVG